MMSFTVINDDEDGGEEEQLLPNMDLPNKTIVFTEEKN